MRLYFMWIAHYGERKKENGEWFFSRSPFSFRLSPACLRRAAAVSISPSLGGGWGEVS
jgi:hypothetical protein